MAKHSIVLRPLQKSDIPKLLVWRNDRELQNLYLGHRFPVTYEMEEKWLEGLDGRTDRLAMGIECKHALVGLVQLKDIDWISRRAEFSILVDPGRQGKDIGTEAGNMMIRKAFYDLGLRKLCVSVLSGNDRAKRLYHNLGFSKEAVLYLHVLVDGDCRDLELWSKWNPPFHNPPRPPMRLLGPAEA